MTPSSVSPTNVARGAQPLDAVADSAPADPTLRVRGLVKRYPGTVALRDLDFEAYPGEVHALLGANGAGKSTMIKIMAGLTGHDEGTIEIGGAPFSRTTSGDRIAFIHQDLGIVDELTVAENIGVVAGFGRHRGRRHGLLSRSLTEQRAAAALAKIGSSISPRATVGTLSRAEKSLVAIARALAEPKDLIFFDEPTASLHAQEVARLFDVVELLRAGGAAVVYVTHRLDEVFRLSTRVSVLRDGARVFTSRTAETDPTEVVAMITGDHVSRTRGERIEPGPVVLRADAVRVATGAEASFAIRRGEIVGVAGLQGAGHVDIGRALCGITGVVSGSLTVDDAAVTFTSTADAISHGVVFVTSNRETEGVAYDMTLQENLFINPTGDGASALRPRSGREERVRTAEVLRQFDVRPPEPNRIIATLSGGNQQKVILARCLCLPSDVVVLEEPTMGVDVGGRADIFAIVRSAATNGKGILVISTDFEELTTICDRILVFDRGVIVDELSGDRIDIATLTRVASGGTHV